MYRLYLDGVALGKNQITLPSEIGDFFKEGICVFIDGVPVYTEVILPDSYVGSTWDETSSPDMTQVGGETNYTLTFEAPHICSYIDLGFGDEVPQTLIPIVGSLWEETSSPDMTRVDTTTTTTNTDCTVSAWHVYDYKSWFTQGDSVAIPDTIKVNIGGTIYNIVTVKGNVGGSIKTFNIVKGNKGGTIETIFDNS